MKKTDTEIGRSSTYAFSTSNKSKLAIFSGKIYSYVRDNVGNEYIAMNPSHTLGFNKKIYGDDFLLIIKKAPNGKILKVVEITNTSRYSNNNRLFLDGSNHLYIRVSNWRKRNVTYDRTQLGGLGKDNCYILKLDLDLNRVWYRKVPSDMVFSNSSFNQNGDVLGVTRLEDSAIAIDGKTFTKKGEEDILIYKYNSSGTLVFTKQISTTKVVRTSTSYPLIDRSSKSYINLYFANPSSDETILINGKPIGINVKAPNKTGIFKFSADGTLERNFSFTKDNSEYYTTQFQKDSNGNLFEFGTVSSIFSKDLTVVRQNKTLKLKKNEYYLAQYGSNDKIKYLKKVLTVGTSSSIKFKIGKDNNLYLYGICKDYILEGSKVFYEKKMDFIVIALDRDGGHRWSKRLEATKSTFDKHNKCEDIYISRNGKIYAVGYSTGDSKIGTTILTKGSYIWEIN